MSARKRPVEADARVGVGHRLGPLERVVDDFLGACEIPQVGKRVTQVGGEANLSGEVIGVELAQLVQAFLEHGDRLVGTPARGVGVTERGEYVGPRARRDRREVEPLLQAGDGVGVAACRGRCQPQRDVRARRGDQVAGDERFVPELGEPRLRVRRAARKPQLELGVGDAQLPLVRVADLRTRLEIVGRDAELAGKHPQRLHGRAPGASLDPRDVRVRHPALGEVALRQAAFEP
jgi:hypothetical protein